MPRSLGGGRRRRLAGRLQKAENAFADAQKEADAALERVRYIDDQLAPGAGGEDAVIPDAAAAGGKGGDLLALSAQSLVVALHAKVEQEPPNGTLSTSFGPSANGFGHAGSRRGGR